MKLCALWFPSLLALAALPVQAQQDRPPITGISHMCVYSSDAAASDHFYGAILKGEKGADPEDPAGVRYYFSQTQFVEVLPLPASHGLSRMAHVAYNTTDVERLHRYLAAHHVAALGGLVKPDTNQAPYFYVNDPEGNRIEFVQPPADAGPGSPEAISTRVIHVGFLVHKKSTEDAFYRELLGFRPYWFGAMQPDKVDWVSQQVPDGHDWLEYMLVGEGSTTPLDHVDARELGVLNHFSLGVPNMEAAVTTLIREDRLSPRHDGPQMGKDGKWQANLYDPDGTRVELMEFQPVVKPCCSGFTAESPAR